MPSTNSSGPALATEGTESSDEDPHVPSDLGEALRDIAEWQRNSWRPRRLAAVARRIARFEEAVLRRAKPTPSS